MKKTKSAIAIGDKPATRRRKWNAASEIASPRRPRFALSATFLGDPTPEGQTRSPICGQVVGLARPAGALSADILHRRCRCRRASTKARFVTIISTEFVAEELPVWGTPNLQFPIQDQQALAAKRTTNRQINVASMHNHRNPPRIIAPARIIIMVLVGKRLH